MGLGVFSISLVVKDIAASRAFYEQLGFSVFGGEQSQNWLIMKQGPTLVGLFQGMFDKNMLTFNPGWDADAKEVNPFDDVRVLQQRLKAAGVKGWSVEFARLARMGLRVLPVPRSEGGGPDLAVMAALAREHRPRLYVTVSVLHNPTGHCLSAAEAHQVLQLAEAHDFLIVEDDTYAWLAPPRTARMAELDGLRRTITVSGFSKILAPQWRVGFLAASPALVERFIDTKLLTTLTSPGVLEAAVADCLEQGLLRRHAERVTALLQQARARTVRLAQAAGCRFVAPPAGLFGWLDTGRDTEALALALLEEGWLTAPGSLFHARPRPTTLMRVNFATADEPRFWQRLKALIDAPARPAGSATPATSSHR